MTAASDDRDEMGDTDILSDDAIEAFLVGEPHPGWQQDAALSAIDTRLAELVALPAPPVGAALARLMQTAPAPAVGPGWTRPVAVPAQVPGWAPDRRNRPRARRIMAGVGAGLALASVALPVAAATHVLPRPAHQAVVQVLEAVTPFDFDAPPAAPPTGVSPTTLATLPPGSPATTAGAPTAQATPDSPPTTAERAGPPPSTPAGGVPGPPPGVTPGAPPVNRGGPPPGIDPGPPAGIDPGPPAGIDPGPPRGINPGPPAGIDPGPPAGIPDGPPAGRDRPGASGRAVSGSTPAGR